MAFTGSLLSSLGRVSVAPSSSSVLLSHHSDAFLSAQSAALESLPATIAKIGGSFGARELARCEAGGSRGGMEQPVMAVAPVSLVAHRYIVQNQLQSSPTLAIDTWKSLLSILRSAVSTASKVLPVVGGIVIWKLLKNDINAQEEQNRITILENNQTHHRIARPDPTGMSVTELQSEIVALRAELDQYRSLIVANKGRESPSAEIGSYEALSESYMRELELTNAKLVHQLNTLTSEVKIHNTREVILMDELSKSCVTGTSL
ncbi:hypothetical protein BCR33DRAFT_780957 [Rhizoclosmatium globosum]|uniref:Uncharacterized protein n=1 Tax=Rhizoclosmatium globosum TaxID=329046 RepID=A0A1Y2CVP8_9FUNG|nr:hypothetical protein BCR33DRAFT_780957 [Rhizoclosmatium globosum]|eukprot:ORY51102.1 hypothetical protein BCR33DRAFT_780957 [Rhizoclosmatium globosum]